MSKEKQREPSKKTTPRSSQPGTAAWLCKKLPEPEEQGNTTQGNSEDPLKASDIKCTGTTDTDTNSS